MVAPFSHSYMGKKPTKFKKGFQGLPKDAPRNQKHPITFNMEPEKGPLEKRKNMKARKEFKGGSMFFFVGGS